MWIGNIALPYCILFQYLKTILYVLLVVLVKFELVSIFGYELNIDNPHNEKTLHLELSPLPVVLWTSWMSVWLLTYCIIQYLCVTVLSFIHIDIVIIIVRLYMYILKLYVILVSTPSSLWFVLTNKYSWNSCCTYLMVGFPVQ